jgi:hypothetical protein
VPSRIPVDLLRRPLAALLFAVTAAASLPSVAAEPFAGIKPGMSSDAAVSALEAANPAFAFSGSYVDRRAGRAVDPGVLTLIACDGVAAGPNCDPPAPDRNYERIVLGVDSASGRVFFVSHSWFPASGREPAYPDFRDRGLRQFPGTPQLIGQQYVRATDVFGKNDIRCLYRDFNGIPRLASPDCGTSLSLTFSQSADGKTLTRFVGVHLDHLSAGDSAMAGQSARDAARDLERMQRGKTRTRSL